MAEIALDTLIESLRRDLQEAERRAAREDLRFTVDKVEVELSVEVRSDADVSGGVKFYVFDFGSKLAEGSSNVQKVTLTLTPARIDGEKLRIRDATVEIEPQ